MSNYTDLKPVNLISKAHCNRIVSGFLTNNLDLLQAVEQDGCSLQAVTITIRHPEVTLFDLANPRLPFCLLPLDALLIIYKFLTLWIQSFLLCYPHASLIQGEDLKTEISISAPKKSLLTTIDDLFMRTICQKINAVVHIKNNESYFAYGLQRDQKIENISEQAKALYHQVLNFYKRFIINEHRDKLPIFDLKQVYQSHVIWEKIYTLGGKKLFILNAGLSLALSYANQTRDNAIFFTEIHRENDPLKLYRKSSFSGIFPEVSTGDHWVIIDKVYTAGSIILAEKRLRQLIKSKIKVIRVGLFPKSLAAIKRCDYIVYAGRLLCVKQILPFLNKRNWQINLIHFIKLYCNEQVVEYER